MLIGEEGVIQWIELTKVKAIRIFNTKDKKNPVLVSEGSADSCVVDFKVWSGLAGKYQQPVQYYIRGWEKGFPKGRAELEEGEENGSARGLRCEDFFLYTQYGMSATGMVAQPQQDVTALIAAAKTGWESERKREEELEDLREEMRELREGGGQSAMIGAVMKGVEPILPQILGHLAGVLMEKFGMGMPNVPALAGVETANDVNESVRVKNVINKLYQHDDKLVLHLEKLLLIAETEPVKWEMLKKMLDS